MSDDSSKRETPSVGDTDHTNATHDTFRYLDRDDPELPEEEAETGDVLPDVAGDEPVIDLPDNDQPEYVTEESAPPSATLVEPWNTPSNEEIARVDEPPDTVDQFDSGQGMSHLDDSTQIDDDRSEIPKTPPPGDDESESINQESEFVQAGHLGSPGATPPTRAEGKPRTADAGKILTQVSSRGAGWGNKATDFLGRLAEPFENMMQPSRALVATTGQRFILGIGLLIALISLLADNAGFSLMVLGMIVPLVVVLVVIQQDVFEREPVLILLGLGAIGLVAGLILGWAGSWVVEDQWIDRGTLNFGAAGYGGRFADAAGNANWLVWLVNGLLLPLISLAAIIAGPIALRRYPRFRNEIMDGAIMGAIGGAGFAIGATIVFLAPGVSDGLPHTSVSDWTLTTIAIIATRPIILTLGGAMLGIAIWRYMRDGNIYSLVMPAVGSVGIWLLLALGTVQLQPAGLSVEFLWNLLLVASAVVLYQRVAAEAVAVDLQAVGADGNRVICPHCRKLTPAGAFCANCGKSLG
jgi:hypothetical protein